MSNERIFATEASRELLMKVDDRGFSISRSGLKTTRTINKDIKQTIEIQITSHQDIIIHALVSSKKVKEWYKAKYGEKKLESIAYFQLGYLTPLNNWMSWHIGLSDIAKEQFVKEASKLIDTYLIPLLDRFNDIDQLVNSLCDNGGKWIKQQKDYWIVPLCFVLVYSDLEKTQVLFDNYLKENPNAKKNIAKHELSSATYNPSAYISSFIGSEEISIVFDNDVVFNR